MKILAPGKLILSGEHSVVYGHPALAMAINRYVTATVSHESRSQILFDFSDMAHHSHLSWIALRALKERVKRKYHRFIKGEYSIRDVLHKPFELAQFALSLFADALNLSAPQGMKLHLQSDIPIGCGMGSSAATILSVIYGISQYMGILLPEEKLFRLALEAENMQHGYSSGLDLRVSLQGGCVYMNESKCETRSIPRFPFYIIHTGSPASTTGQCLETVASFFKTSLIGQDFAAVTHAMDSALQLQSNIAMHDAIRQNHQLLLKIGVVPPKVQQFIHALEVEGMAAKISGAGAITGEQAGIVLAMAQDKMRLQTVTKQYGYDLIPILGECRGVHAA